MIKKIYAEWYCKLCDHTTSKDPGDGPCPACGDGKKGGYLGKGEKEYQDYLKSPLDPRD